LPTFKSQDLTLHTPAKGVGDSDRYLEIGGKIAPYFLILFVLEEPLPGSAFSQLANHRSAEKFSSLVGQLKHPDQNAERTIDRAIGGTLSLPVQNVGGNVRLTYGGDPPPSKDMVEMSESPHDLDHVP